MLDGVSTNPLGSPTRAAVPPESIAAIAAQDNNEAPLEDDSYFATDTAHASPNKSLPDPFQFDSSDDDIPLPQLTPLGSPSHALLVLPEQPPVEQPLEDTIPEVWFSPPRRALRARKPEQQMPYTLDLIRHRDQFRRRGLKPVHNPDSERHPHQGVEDDEQFQADDEDEGEVDKYERYVPLRPEVGRPTKRRRREGNETAVNGRLRIGEAGFIHPPKVDLPRPSRSIQEVTPELDVTPTRFCA
jgi:hypothetical protein